MKLWRFLSRKTLTGNKAESNSQRSRCAQRPAMVEPLEPRLLLSADLTYAAGVGESLDLALCVHDNGTDPAVFQLLDNAAETETVVAERQVADTSGIVITGGDLDDRLAIDISDSILVPITFDGGDGEDVLEFRHPNYVKSIDGEIVELTNGHLIEANNVEAVEDSMPAFLLIDGTSLNDVINDLLDSFDTASPPTGSDAIFTSSASEVPNIITVGTTLGGGVDLELTDITLEFTGLSFNGTSWTGEVKVGATSGALFEGLLGIEIADNDDADSFAVVGVVNLAADNSSSYMELDDFDVEIVNPVAVLLGWPAFLNVVNMQLELNFADFRVDDNQNSLLLSVEVDGLNTGIDIIDESLADDDSLFSLDFQAFASVELPIKEIEDTALAAGRGDLKAAMEAALAAAMGTKLTGFGASISGKILRLGSFSGEFLCNTVTYDPDGAGPDPERKTVYMAIEASFGSKWLDGGSLALAISPLGPLQWFLSVDVPITLEPITGLAISSLHAGARFNTTIEGLQTETDFYATGATVEEEEYPDPNDSEEPYLYKVTLTIPGHDLHVGDDFRVRNAVADNYNGDFEVLTVNGDQVTYRVKCDPGTFVGDAEIVRLTIKDPLDLQDDGLNAGPDVPDDLFAWKDQLDAAVRSQLENGYSNWLSFLEEMVFGGGASLSFDPRIPDWLLEFNGDFLIDTKGRIFLKVEKSLLDGLVKYPTRLYADLSDLSNGDGRFLYYQTQPETPVFDPLLVYRGEVSFETIAGTDVLDALVTDTTADGYWTVEFELALDNPSSEYSIGDNAVIFGSNPYTFDGAYEVVAVNDEANTISVRINCDLNGDGIYDPEEISSTNPGTWISGGKVANENALNSFRIALEGGVDLNIPGINADLEATTVTTLTLEGGMAVEFQVPDPAAPEELRTELSFTAALSETHVGYIALATGMFVVAVDVDAPPDEFIGIYGAAVLTTELDFLEHIGLFTDASGLLRINSTDDEKGPISLERADGTRVEVALPANSFALRLDGSTDFRIDFNSDGIFAPRESVFEMTGTFVLEFSSDGFNAAVFREVGGNVQAATLQLGSQYSRFLEFDTFAFFAIRSNGIAGNLVLMLNDDASGPLTDLVDLNGRFVLIMNTTGEEVVFDLPDGAADPNRPAGVSSVTIPEAGPQKPIALAETSVDNLINGYPWAEKVAAGPYGVLFFEGNLTLLSVVELSTSGYVSLSPDVLSMQLVVAGDFLGLTSVEGSARVSSEGEFEFDIEGSVQLGWPGVLSISGSCQLHVCYFDSNKEAYGGDGNRVLDVGGILKGSVEIGGVEVDVELAVSYEPYSGEISVNYEGRRFVIGTLKVEKRPCPDVDEGMWTIEMQDYVDAAGGMAAAKALEAFLGDLDFKVEQIEEAEEVEFGPRIYSEDIGDFFIRHLGGDPNAEILKAEIEVTATYTQEIYLYEVVEDEDGNTERILTDTIVVRGSASESCVAQNEEPLNKVIVNGTNVADTIVLDGVLAVNEVNGRNGGDYIYLSGYSGSSDTEGRSLIHGNEGDDWIYGGTGDDEVYGDAGDDHIWGHDGSDTIYGDRATLEDEWSAGFTDFIYGGIGSDVIFGDAGGDTIHGNSDTDLIWGGAGIDYLYGDDGNDWIWGGEETDYIHGGEHDDHLYGQDGDDEIDGGDGSDYIEGNIGVDEIDGGDDGDEIHGNEDGDFIYGDAGNDEIYGEEGGDEIQGGEGYDVILGDSGEIEEAVSGYDDVPRVTLSLDYDGNDVINGGDDRDWIYGQRGDDTLEGGAGDDMIFGGFDVDYIYGEDQASGDAGSGNDYIEGERAGDHIWGNGGDDVIHGDGEDDHIYGNAGNDEIYGEAGDDTIDGGSGHDIVLGDSGTIVGGIKNAGDPGMAVPEVDFSTEYAGNDIIKGGMDNDWIYGQGGHDILIGDDGSVNSTSATASGSGDTDHIYGQEGEDKVLGGGGDDYLYGFAEDAADSGSQRDIIVGDGGAITYGSQFDFNTVNQVRADSSSGGNDTIQGNEGDDIILAGAGGDTSVQGNAGNDIILGDNGTIDLSSGVLSDISTAGESVGGADKLWGDSGDDGNDIIIGGPSGDEIYGEEDNDILIGDNGAVNGTRVESSAEGSDGADEIYGQEGDDKILGGADDDRLYGDKEAVGEDLSGKRDILIGDSGTIVYAGNRFEFNDVISVTNSGRTQGGNDTLEGNDGDDIVLGGAGGDTSDQVDPGRDVILGDNGTVTLDKGQLVTIGTGGESVGGADTVKGGTGNDIIIGGPNGSSDNIQGNEGQDIILGDNGVVEFNADDDLATLDEVESALDGIGGDDTLSGNADGDIIVGGYGADTIYGDNAGADSGDDGGDILLGDNGRVLLRGESVGAFETFNSAVDKVVTTDTTEDSGGGDTINGNAGNDIIVGGANNGGIDTLNGNAGDDIILGDNGLVDFNTGDNDLATVDVIRSQDFELGGRDIISGNEGMDIAIGGSADDEIAGNSEADILIGDQGEVVYENGLVTDIASTDTQESHGGIDSVSGGSDDDIVIGGVAGDVLNGRDGNDVLLGDEGALKYNRLAPSGGDDDPETLDLIRTHTYDLGGQDTISGNVGDDVVMGGMEHDTIYGDDADASGGALDGQDVLLGDNGKVILKGNQDGVLTNFGSAVEKINTTDTAEETGAVDTIEGNAGSDVILGGVQGDTLYGDRRNPTTESIASDGDDVILGDNGRLNFDAGDDDLTTLDIVASNLDTRGGVDTISGNAGSDVAIGGTAGDTIYGDDAGATGRASDGRDILLGDNAQIDLDGNTGQMHILDSAIKTIWTTDEEQNTGGEDTISGNAAGDYIVGGVMGDLLHGDASVPDANDGDDVILGDNGRLDWGYQGDQNFAEIESGMIFDDSLNTLDLVTTELPEAQPGGRDTIFGDDGSDTVFGGTDSDLLYGDDGDAAGSDLNSDLLFGDHGRLYPQHSTLPDANSENFFAVDTGDTDGGEGDRIYGEEGDDIMLGQQGDDRMFGGTGDDDMIGGHNVETGIDELSDPTINATVNPSVNDVMDGGAGDDAMAGDNAVIWRRGDSESDRFRMLDGEQLYYPYDPIGTDDGNPDGAAAVTDGAQADPRGTVGRVITLLDHDSDTEDMDSAKPWGIDLIAGNADYDLLFGQLGDDIVQGDGAIYPADELVPDATTVIVTFADTGDPNTSQAFFFEVFEASSDGDDYIEGNGGSDTLYGGLGQDDILGGSSDLFGLVTAQQRPDGSDTIYGGSATTARMQRNAFVDEEDLFVSLEDRHACDSDMILGDNGRIFRPVGTSSTGPGTLLLFAYDQSDPESRIPGIVPRAIDLLDYIPGVGDAEETVSGAGDLIRGESGDDFLHGMMGQDVIYGGSEDDDIFGESQSDLLFGGTGEDGILGDDGYIFTSRNDTSGEPLYGIEEFANNELSDSIRTPGGIQEAKINVEYELKKTVNLEPFDLGAADIIYGGLGDDFLHGGAGDDAISGAEILDVESAGDNGTTQFVLSYSTPFTPDSLPEDTLGFNVKDPGIKSRKAEEFWLYDEYEPLRRIVVNIGTEEVPDYRAFFLNFQAFTDAEDPVGTMIHDGNDVVFGDLGNDWLVGGTDQDHLYGGYGCDLLNADDNLDTNGGLNDEPDVPAFAGTAYGALSDDANQVGADTVYGGAGRDILIGNTGADRLIDWVGEFNSYLVPYAPYGQFSVSRSLQPHLRDYLYELSESDGADPTRSDDVGSDPLRNGEPYGELGMVLQQDADWKDQTGAPNDPQAGNIPGGKRDVMESIDFQEDTAGPLAAETGGWEVAAGKYVATSIDGGDAVSIFFISDYQPTYMEVATTVNMDKDKGGRDANAYVIFDYMSPTDFKFAGISLKEQKLQIGHRTETGWVVDVQLPMNFKAGADYRLLVALNGTTATLVVNNSTSLSHAFTYPLNEGLIALGVDNAVTRFDEVQALRLPPQITYESTEDFADSVPGSFTTQAGSWAIQDGRYTGSAVEDVALTTFALDASPLAYVELESKLRTDSSAGLVFDYYSAEDFKFVMVMADTDQIVIGHRTAKGWFYDAVYYTEIDTDTDYDVKVCLKGTTVSVMLDDQAMLGHVFNGIVTDGEFGMLSLYGLGVFDYVTARTDDLLDF